MVVTPASHCGIHTGTGNAEFHSCAHAAIVEEDNTTIYLEQGSAVFKALPEVSHHCRKFSGNPSSLHSVILDQLLEKENFKSLTFRNTQQSI